MEGGSERGRGRQAGREGGREGERGREGGKEGEGGCKGVCTVWHLRCFSGSVLMSSGTSEGPKALTKEIR